MKDRFPEEVKQQKSTAEKAKDIMKMILQEAGVITIRSLKELEELEKKRRFINNYTIGNIYEP